MERAAEVYGRQGRHLGDQSTLLLAEEGGSPVGFALRYHHQDMLYARVAGFDYGFDNRADYFNLVFYHPIDQGTGRSTRAIHLGLGTFEAKLTRAPSRSPCTRCWWASTSRSGPIPTPYGNATGGRPRRSGTRTRGMSSVGSTRRNGNCEQASPR